MEVNSITFEKDTMDYKEKEALVSEINRDSITVFIPCESTGKCKSCASYGMCGAQGSSISYNIPVENPEKFNVRETVTVGISAPPFFVSVFFVFMLPLLLMLAGPVIAYNLYHVEKEMYIIGTGFAGLVLGLLIGKIIDSLYSSKEPPVIRDDR